MPKKPRNPPDVPPPKAAREVRPNRLPESDVLEMKAPLAVLDAANENAAQKDKHERRASRVLLNVEIGIDDHTNFYVGFSENVSAGGLFIATYRLLPVGTEVALTFVLPNELPLFVLGLVRWVRDPQDLADSAVPPGMGVEFSNLGQPEQARIHAYIEGHAPMFYPD